MTAKRCAGLPVATRTGHAAKHRALPLCISGLTISRCAGSWILETV
jgi:hypothetical protein